MNKVDSNFEELEKKINGRRKDINAIQSGLEVLGLTCGVETQTQGSNGTSKSQ